MQGVNKAIIIGNLTRDPEVKRTKSDHSVTTFSLATNRKFKKGDEMVEEVEYHNCVAWGKAGEIIAQYMQKGGAIYIEGRLQTRMYEKDGQKHYPTEIVVEEFTFLGGKADGNSGGKKPVSRGRREEEEVIEDDAAMDY